MYLRKDIVFTDDVCSVAVAGDVKQTKRHVRKQVFTFKLFPTKELCLHTHLRQYISLTQTTEEFLFLTFGGRRRRATKDTLARYVKSVLIAAGIPLRFAPHSVLQLCSHQGGGTSGRSTKAGGLGPSHNVYTVLPQEHYTSVRLCPHVIVLLNNPAGSLNRSYHPFWGSGTLSKLTSRTVDTAW